MKKLLAFGVVLGVLMAGCQEGTKFQIKGQRDPEQLGLRFEVLGDFGRASSNLGRFYSEEGELVFRVFRLTNVSGEVREVYPSMAGVPSSALDLKIRYWSLIPRWMKTFDLTFGGDLPIADRLDEYRSEFQLREIDFDFEGGGVEALPLRAGPTPASIRLRPGESAVLRAHLVLRPDLELIPFPRDRGLSPEEATLRAAILFEVVVKFHGTPALLALDPEAKTLHPLYLPSLAGPFRLFDEVARGMGSGENARLSAWGLPVQI